MWERLGFGAQSSPSDLERLPKILRRLATGTHCYLLTAQPSRFWRETDHRLSPVVKNLKLNLLRNSERIVYLDAQVSDGAFELRVTEQGPPESYPSSCKFVLPWFSSWSGCRRRWCQARLM